MEVDSIFPTRKLHPNENWQCGCFLSFSQWLLFSDVSWPSLLCRCRFPKASCQHSKLIESSDLFEWRNLFVNHKVAADKWQLEGNWEDQLRSLTNSLGNGRFARVLTLHVEQILGISVSGRVGSSRSLKQPRSWLPSRGTSSTGKQQRKWQQKTAAEANQHVVILCYSFESIANCRDLLEVSLKASLRTIVFVFVVCSSTRDVRPWLHNPWESGETGNTSNRHERKVPSLLQTNLNFTFQLSVTKYSRMFRIPWSR